jgi:hypothetical protein
MKTSLVASLVLSLAFGLLTSGCASSAMKARKAERDKLASQGKMYCDFVNGELFPDVEIQLNLEMAKRCDPDKSISITNYKNPSENVGIMYCCSSPSEKKEAAAEVKTPAAPKKEEPKKEEPKKEEVKKEEPKKEEASN